MPCPIYLRTGHKQQRCPRPSLPGRQKLITGDNARPQSAPETAPEASAQDPATSLQGPSAPRNSTPPDRSPRLSTSLSFLLLLRHEFVVVLPRFYVSLGSHHACALLVTGCSRVHAHVCVCARVCACACVHVRVCACVCEREGEREGGADACVIDFLFVVLWLPAVT